MERKPIITLANVAFSYTDRPFLKDINLNVFEKDFLGIVGPNGGGKTTLLKLILGVVIPSSGSIKVFNTSSQKGRLHIGYLSQYEDVDFDFPITVWEIVLMSRLKDKLFHYYSSSDKEAAKDALKQMNIWSLRYRKLDELSGGEKQKVFLARALAGNPKALILDEPLSNIDVQTQDDLYEILTELNKEITIIIVDHNLERLTKYVKEIACVNKCLFESLEFHDLDKGGI